ncbi:MAG TPA: rod shape-determining protein, partial [Clostridia bacterium]|nr:rod shape-determining protein [Clostridia bacterium]
MGFFRQNIAVDLGTATILVSVENKGVVIKEPSIVAIKDASNKILAIGEEARSLMGRTPFDISTVKPIQNGVISSYYTTMRMLKYYYKKALRNPLKKILKPDVIICVPSQTTDVEKRAVKKASQDAG